MQTNSYEFCSLFSSNYSRELLNSPNETKCHELSKMQTTIQTKGKYDFRRM